jgi:uncharacterized membrane protein
MLKVAFLQTWKRHSFEFVLLMIISVLSLKFIFLEIDCTKGITTAELLIAGFFWLVTVLYPILSFLTFYFQAKIDRLQEEIDENGKV